MVVDLRGRKGFEDGIGSRGCFAEDELADPESEGVEYERFFHVEVFDELLHCSRYGSRSFAIRLLKSVDNAGLPGMNFLVDDAIAEVEFNGDLTEHRKPCKFSGLLEGFKARRIARLKRVNFGRDGEGSGMERRPEQAREDLCVDFRGWLGLGALVKLLIFADDGINASGVEDVS